ncbi:cell cycle regulator of non-homologous end joining [Cottoperca gobio]|uniref:Cell cycle regulator of non-homologous end joining n=1 Tax=Cottoperca gobio TaxID=56716 RepID=A0A6J2PXS5_COTGO|nr:cell cycle regulator of non-homologous end joining-like [Cottoperca gobio]
MSERHRALPPWMTKKQEKGIKKEPLKSRRKRKTARDVFYCMNEKELVEAAVSYLTKSNGACDDVALPTDQKVEGKAVDTTVKSRENPATSKTIAKLGTLEEDSSDCGDAPESTDRVSETDLDMTEVETVPYTKSPQHHGPEGQRSGPVQDHGGLVNVGLQTEEKQKHSQIPAEEEEEDAFRLVREIFFT